jgi:hypothetical protein
MEAVPDTKSAPRQTLAPGILPSTRSMLSSLSPPYLFSASNAAPSAHANLPTHDFRDGTHFLVLGNLFGLRSHGHDM